MICILFLCFFLCIYF